MVAGMVGDLPPLAPRPKNFPERLLNPVLGKSLVVYAQKPIRGARGAATTAAAGDRTEPSTQIPEKEVAHAGA